MVAVGWRGGGGAARASTSAATTTAVELTAASRRRRRQRWRRAGGEGPQREAETPQQESQRDPCRGTRHEESNLKPQQLGAAGAEHHRGNSEQCPCRAAPPHGQPGQATAERAAQRRPPYGSARPEGLTFDSLVMALELPTSGTLRPQLRCSRSRGRPFSHVWADRWARTPRQQMRPGVR